MAEVRLQQGGLYQRFMSEAEGDLWAGLDSRAGLCKHRVASSWDFQAQQLTWGKDERVRAAGKRSGERKEAGPRANPDSGAAGRCYIVVSVHLCIRLCWIWDCIRIIWVYAALVVSDVLENCCRNKKTKGSFFSSLRCSSTQRTLSPSVPTGSEHRAKLKTWKSRFIS